MEIKLEISLPVTSFYEIYQILIIVPKSNSHCYWNVFVMLLPACRYLNQRYFLVFCEISRFLCQGHTKSI